MTNPPDSARRASDDRGDLRPRLREQLASYSERRHASRLRRALRRGLPLAVVRASRTLGPLTGRPIPVTASTFWGDRMAVRLPEGLSCELYGYGYFEEGLTAFLIAELPAGGRLFDVGAHYGYFTRLGAALVGREGEVHSFEPTPSTFGLLARNTADLSNVTANQVAVWHEAAELELSDFGPAMSMYNSLFTPRLAGRPRIPAGRYPVQAVPLDEYAESAGSPDFVKIDAESAELSVLRGMEALIAAARPKITLEVGDFGVEDAPASRSVLEWVIDRGYEPYEYVNGRIQAHELRETYGYDNILLVANS